MSCLRRWRYAAVLAQQVDEPFGGWNGTQAVDDRGQTAVEHRHTVYPKRWLESAQPRRNVSELIAFSDEDAVRAARKSMIAASRLAREAFHF